MTNFQWFFLQKFKEDTNVHLAKVQIKRGREPMSYYLITFICSEFQLKTFEVNIQVIAIRLGSLITLNAVFVLLLRNNAMLQQYSTLSTTRPTQNNSHLTLL